MKTTLTLLFSCITCFSSTYSLANSSFGRLLTSPEERYLIDNKKTVADKTTNNTSPVTIENTSIDESKIHLSGFISRSDGRKMVWLNGKGFFDNETLPDGLIIGEPNSQLLTIPLGVSLGGNNQKINLKPGQIWQPATGIINESFKINKKAVPSP